MEYMTNDFFSAIRENNIERLNKIPKSDLHTHFPLGCNLSVFERIIKKELPKLPYIFSFTDFEEYITKNISFYLKDRLIFESAIAASFEQANRDNILILSPTMSIAHLQKYRTIHDYTETITRIYKKVCKNTRLYPFFGIKNEYKLTKKKYSKIIDLIDSGFFKGIDIIGDESFNNYKSFLEILKYAKSNQMKIKAHIGERSFDRDAYKQLTLLGLDEIQHGIRAIDYPKALEYIKDNSILVNTCPTSNIRLGNITDNDYYPLRALYDNGVKITINTDDIMIFDKNVSQEYLNLFKNKIFSANELNEIRINGLKYN